MNLDTLIDQWIVEERTENAQEDQSVCDEVYYEQLKNIGYNQALQDLKSRKQELIEGIESMYFDYAKHEQAKFLDGFAHPKDCEECLKELK